MACLAVTFLFQLSSCHFNCHHCLESPKASASPERNHLLPVPLDSKPPNTISLKEPRKGGLQEETDLKMSQD